MEKVANQNIPPEVVAVEGALDALTKLVLRGTMGVDEAKKTADLIWNSKIGQKASRFAKENIKKFQNNG